MIEAVDHVVPISNLLRRMERYQDDLRQDLNKLPWWAYKRRYVLLGAIAAYQIEIEALLKLGGASQPLWEQLTASR